MLAIITIIFILIISIVNLELLIRHNTIMKQLVDTLISFVQDINEEEITKLSEKKKALFLDEEETTDKEVGE